MISKFDFATFRTQLPQEWPRYSVGLIAVVGLRNGLEFLWFSRPSNVHEKLSVSLDALGESAITVRRTIQGGCVGLAAYILYANSMALRGALRRDPRNIRTAFKMWLVPQVLFNMPLVLFLMKVGIEGVSNREIVDYCGYLFMTAVDGWSMFVLMRDQRGQKRNIYGFLVEDDSEAKSEKGSVPERGPTE